MFMRLTAIVVLSALAGATPSLAASKPPSASVRPTVTLRPPTVQAPAQPRVQLPSINQHVGNHLQTGGQFAKTKTGKKGKKDKVEYYEIELKDATVTSY